jgi:hypothetical protein
VRAVAMRELDGLSGSLAEEIEFCPSCFSASNRLYVHNIRRMKREYSLYALVVDNSAYRESLVNPAAPAGDYCAGKDLNPLLVAFPDSAAYIYRIAYFKMRYVFLETFTFDSIQNFSFHRLSPILFTIFPVKQRRVFDIACFFNNK